jgi:hypothetical protein
MTRPRIIAALMFFGQLAFGQMETANWYFGYFSGLTFTNTIPAPLASPNFSSYEGGASMSDGAGNLLFYTDANTVWNASHAVMGNGTGLLGDQSSTQSSLIIKHPGSNSLYIIFTTGQTAQKGLRYHIVDMSLAGGTGSVVTKNIQLYTQTCEKLAAVEHCNGNDYWLLSYDDDGQRFRNFLVTAAGVSLTPVITNIGSVQVGYNTLGQLKVNPYGTRLAAACFNANRVELFDFNASTGAVSNLVTLSLPPNTSSYGVEFSLDGTKLYASIWGANAKLYQWDLCAGSMAAIVASAYTLAVPNSPGLSSMQTGIDGKIYVNGSNTNSLSVINNPNGLQSACNFSVKAQPVTGTTSLGLPTFCASLLRPAANVITMSQTCAIVSFSSPYSIASCSGPMTFTSQVWNFGDPASGSLNTSSQDVVSHTYNATGTYTVSLVLSSACGTKTLTKIVTVAGTPISVSGSTLTCPGVAVVLTATGAASYQWNNGPNTSSISVSPTVTSTYYVVGTYTSSCQPITVAVTVSVMPAPQVSLVASPTVCAGSSLTLAAVGGDSWQWTGGVTGSVNIVTPAQTSSYGVTGFYMNGCAPTSAVLTVSVIQLPVLSVSGATSTCKGSLLTFTAGGASTYSWSTGAQTPSLVIAVNTATVLSVTGIDQYGCKSTRQVSVALQACLGERMETGPDGSLSVFPNPAKDHVTVSSTIDCMLFLYRQSGELIGRKRCYQNATVTFSIPAPGLYLLIRESGEKRVAVKVVCE